MEQENGAKNILETVDISEMVNQRAWIVRNSAARVLIINFCPQPVFGHHPILVLLFVSSTGMTSFYRISESRMLPPEMWNKILYHAFIGREGPDTDTLKNCRKVCKEWKEMIKSFVWKKPNKEWGIITKSMIEKNWVISFLESFPTEKMIAHAKSLGKSRKNKIPYKLWLSFSFTSCRNGRYSLFWSDDESCRESRKYSSVRDYRQRQPTCDHLLRQPGLPEMIHFTSFSKSKSVLGFRDCETYAESYFFSLAFLEALLKCRNCLRIDMKDVVCRSRFFTNLPKLKIDKA